MAHPPKPLTQSADKGSLQRRLWDVHDNPVPQLVRRSAEAPEKGLKLIEAVRLDGPINALHGTTRQRRKAHPDSR